MRFIEIAISTDHLSRVQVQKFAFDGFIGLCMSQHYFCLISGVREVGDNVIATILCEYFDQNRLLNGWNLVISGLLCFCFGR